MKRQKKINKVYINIGLLVTFFLIAIFLLFIIIFTKGDMTPPIIVDINEELSGVFNNTVIVDDRTRDYFYYKGLNYTDTADGTLPTGSNRGLYKDNQLVDVDLTYYSLDLNSNLNAYVSLSERQDKYVYYKIYPINDNGTSNLNDDYVLIELIENPFTDRPTDKGFNGWTTNYVGAELFHNKDYYIREVKVPVTYTGTTPNKITISFNAVWGPANVSEISNSRNWSTALGSLDSAGMKPLDVLTYVYEDYDMTGYFERVSIGFFSSIAGYYNDYGVLQTSGMCTSWGGCTYYRRIENELFDDSNTYYESTPYMVLVDNSTLPIPKTLTYVNGFTATSNMGSYFKKVLIPRYSSYEGYYDASGGIQGSGTCNTNAGCTYYELINYYDENGNPSIYDEDEDYYYLITRDLNILYMTSNISNAWGNINKPFTLTSLHNGNKRNVTWTVNFALRAYADVNIENLTISSGSNPTTSSPPTGTNSSRDFYGSWNNVRIGRGIERNGNYTSWTAFVGGYSGSTGSASNTTKYRVIIESGYFSTVTIGYTTGSSNSYLEARAIYGNDYDRVQKNNDDLMVHYVAAGSWGGTVRSSSNTAIAFDHIVKSGSFGSSKYNHTTGFYIGGRNQGTYYAARQIKVEGGWIYNAIGGPMSDSSRANHNDVYAYMVGGEVDAFFGGAGTSTTYGNRILQITGGKVNYAVFGGSNSYNGSSSDGQIEGSSFIYIGGNAVIGDPTLVSNNSSIWGAEAGSVFGIGNGRTGSSYTSLGSMRNSNIIITDHATINKNVYGGGNFGALGTSGVSTTTTNMWIYGGTVKGDVYGAGNINGSGATNRLSTINIYTYDGEVEGSLYGGSNEEGIVYGSVNMDILGGTFYGTVYGGGRGGYTNSSNPGTYIRDAINIQVGTESSTPVLLDGLYGGSAYGTVNADNQTASLSSHGINITIDNADVTGSVFGGSKGSSSFSPNTNGHINITVNGGTIPSLFGGNDMSGIVMGNSTIILNGGTIGETYGGGNQVSGNNSYITLNGATTNNIFGGSNQSGDMLSSTINLISGTNINAYGGNNIGGETATTNVKVVGGNLTNVYGGGKLADTGETNVTLTSGTIPNVYGGGESANIDNETNIVLTSATVGNLFGGSNQSGSVPKSTIDINGGTATNVYGGNNAGGNTTTSLINITNGNITTSYGGGKLADTGKTTTNVSGGTIQSLFGGGEEASIDTNTTLNISGGTITNIYGGSNVDGSVPESNITINGGTTTTLYGGNNMGGTTTESKIVINTGKINKVFGGGNQAETTTSNITLNNNINVIDYIYGGGNLAEVKTTNVNINAGKVGYIYGGGNQAGVETTNVDIDGGTASYVFGGSNQNGDVETSNIIVKNNPIIGEIYGGNNAGGNTDDIYIKTYGGTVNNIYGGGNEADSGTTNLVIKDTYINQEIYGGGKDGKLLGSATTTITDSKILLSVYSGGKGETATVFGNTTINIEGTSIIGEHVFGGGNAALTGSEALNNSTSVVNIAGADIGLNVYGGANTSVVYGTAEVYIGNISGLDNQKITIGGTVFGR